MMILNHGNKSGIILFEVMCVVLLVSVITLFVFKGMARSAKAIKKSQAYFINLDKANKLHWEACSSDSGPVMFNITISSLDGGQGVKLDL